MSLEQNYHPPKTKWNWESKVLNTSPWFCDIGKQVEPAFDLWPASAEAYVDLSNGTYQWRVSVVDFQLKHYEITGSDPYPLQACLAAEQVAEDTLREIIPGWVRTALTNKWWPLRNPYEKVDCHQIYEVKTMNDLKPCPFCSGKAVLRCTVYTCQVQCTECGASGLQTHSEDRAVAAWNRRHDDREPMGKLYVLINKYIYEYFNTKKEREEYIRDGELDRSSCEFRTVRRYRVKR